MYVVIIISLSRSCMQHLRQSIFQKIESNIWQDVYIYNSWIRPLKAVYESGVEHYYTY